MEIKIISPSSVKIDGPPIIPTIEPPVTKRAERSVTHGLQLPIINIPDPSFKYPVIDVPTQEEFDAAVRAEQKKQEEEKEEKTRGLPDSQPIIPQVQIPQESIQDKIIKEKGAAQIQYIDRIVQGDTIKETVVKDMTPEQRAEFEKKVAELQTSIKNCPVPKIVIEEHNKAAIRAINDAAKGEKK